MDYNMLGHPITNTASLISLTAATKMASETTMSTLLTRTTTTTIQTQATQSAPPLSSIAKTLTRYLFGDIALPSFLQ
jgi:hypothetical protein